MGESGRAGMRVGERECERVLKDTREGKSTEGRGQVVRRCQEMVGRRGKPKGD